MFRRTLIAGTVLAVASYLLVSHNPTDQRAFGGLLGLGAAAILGAVWKRQSATRNANPIVIAASFASLVAFFLADPALLGFRGVAAIIGSFAVAGLLGLLQSRR